MHYQKIVALALVVACATVAQASDPRLNVITPRGIQRGVDTVVTFRGARLNDAEEQQLLAPHAGAV